MQVDSSGTAKILGSVYSVDIHRLDVRSQYIARMPIYQGTRNCYQKRPMASLLSLGIIHCDAMPVINHRLIQVTFLRSVLMSYPAIEAVPLVGGMSPVRILNVVVLPAPKVQPSVMANPLLGMDINASKHRGPCWPHPLHFWSLTKAL